MIEVDYSKLADRNLREFWLKNNLDEGKKKITEEEYELIIEAKEKLPQE